MIPIRKSRSVEERFLRYGIKSLSPTSLNLWISEPARWVLQYIYKIKESGPAMWRGRAVEAGLITAISYRESSLEDCLRGALSVFDSSKDEEFEKISPEDCEKIADERNTVEDQIKTVIDEFREKIPQSPIAIQRKVDLDIGIEVPLSGRLDVEFENFFDDIKSTNSMPSSYETVKVSMRRQISFYSAGTGKPGRLVFVSKRPNTNSHSGLKIFEIPEDESKELMSQYVNAARAIRRVLMNTETPEEIAEMLIPNYDSYFWSERTKTEAKKIWTAA